MKQIELLCLFHLPNNYHNFQMLVLQFFLKETRNKSHLALVSKTHFKTKNNFTRKKKSQKFPISISPYRFAFDWDYF